MRCILVTQDAKEDCFYKEPRSMIPRTRVNYTILDLIKAFLLVVSVPPQPLI